MRRSGDNFGCQPLPSTLRKTRAAGNSPVSGPFYLSREVLKLQAQHLLHYWLLCGFWGIRTPVLMIVQVHYSLSNLCNPTILFLQPSAKKWACVSTYVCMFMCVHMCACISTCACAGACVCTCMCVSMCVSVHVFVYIHVCISSCACAHACV